MDTITNVNITELNLNIDAVKTSIDAFMLCTMGAIVWTMQAGFACLEAGACRTKHVTSILFKNIMDNFVCAIAYWAVGYALAFGEPSNAFFGYNHFMSINLPATKFPFWVFQFAFAAVACTIISGAIAERMQTIAYLIITAFIGGFVYPMFSHWVWAEKGWLLKNGYHDFAGSSVVHIFGATCSLTCAVILGPRVGRFGKNGEKGHHYKGHSMPLTAMGGFILFVAFLAFNGGSVLSVTSPGGGETMARAMVSTIVMGAAGSIAALVASRSFSCEASVNGALAGMVAACAGCNQFTMWASVIVGLLAATNYILLSKIITRLKVDDPTSAIAVHFGGGMIGEIAVPVFSFEYGLLYFGNTKGALENLGWQIIGFVTVVVWCMVLVGMLCVILRFMGILRVPSEAEEKGLDIYIHKEPAYPHETLVRVSKLLHKVSSSLQKMTESKNGDDGIPYQRHGKNPKFPPEIEFTQKGIAISVLPDV